ncbi:MAG: PIN domain-containing protein [candidate division NC10 bacterium]|nr:PIN domain-containing protein [candidate division NC10 bacterium]
MRPGDPVFLDTNILVYAVDRDSPLYQKAKAIVDQVDAGEMNACISPQVLGELYAVTTTPGRIRRPLSLKGRSEGRLELLASGHALEDLSEADDDQPNLCPRQNLPDRRTALLRCPDCGDDAR